MTMTSKLAVVTGAAKPGIGEAITRRLASDGFRVIGSYDEEHRLNADHLMEQLDAVTMVQVDHADRNALQDFVNSLPNVPINALVNAMMYFEMEDPDNFEESVWDRSLAINLTAPNFLIHRLKPKFSDNASIVTITSTEAYVGSYGASAYAATKAAIHNLTKTHANNLGGRGIRVNVVAPGWIGGVMDTDEVFNLSKKITPLGRLGSPEEVAAVVAFLVGEDSTFVNGTVITVDGGYTGVDTISKYEFGEFIKSKRKN